MTEQEELATDLRLINEITQHHAWAVVEKYIRYGIEKHMDLLLTPTLDMNQTQALRHRVLAYKDLLDLPALIRQQAKQSLPATESGEGTDTEP